MSIISKITFIIFIITLFHLTFEQVCERQNIYQIQLSNYKIQKTNNYQYLYLMHQNQVQVQKNDNGTNFNGNFSTLVLKNTQNKQFIYEGIRFSFECPALHKPTKNAQMMVELQITYKFKQQAQYSDSKRSQQDKNQKQTGPYEYIMYSFPFVVSQFIPQNSQPINKYINSTLQSGTSLNLSNILRNPLSISALVYVSKHPVMVQKNILRLISKQLRLMSKNQLKQLKILIEPETNLKIESRKKYKMQKPDKIYEIKSYPISKSSLFEREEF